MKALRQCFTPSELFLGVITICKLSPGWIAAYPGELDRFKQAHLVREYLLPGSRYAYLLWEYLLPGSRCTHLLWEYLLLGSRYACLLWEYLLPGSRNTPISSGSIFY